MTFKILTGTSRSNRTFALILSTNEEIHLRRMILEDKIQFNLSTSVEIDFDDSFMLKYVCKALYHSDAIVISEIAIESNRISEAMIKCHLQGCSIIEWQKFLITMRKSIETDQASVTFGFAKHSLRQSGAIRFYGLMKSLFEPVIALFMLILLSPLLFIVAIAIKITSHGPILYTQIRCGKNNFPFSIYKFRSMQIDAEKAGPVWASARSTDARLTPIGGFLRASHIDELPQLINVLKGELSFIGPRPERPVFVEQLKNEIPLFDIRSFLKPGITGWAQVMQGYANSVDDSRRKLELDLYYILRHSPFLDFKILLLTFGLLSKGGSEGKKRINELRLATLNLEQRKQTLKFRYSNSKPESLEKIS